MKYLLVLVVILIAGLAYYRNQNPHEWNQYLLALKATEPGDVTASQQTTVPVAPAAPKAPEYVTPDSAVLNPDHTRPVDNPPPSTTPATTPTAPASAPASIPTTDANTRPAGTFVPPNPLPRRLNWNWTVAGKVYSNVTIQKVEADCVTIMYSEGGARLNIAQLDPEIQKLLNYDPQAAAMASSERARDDAASAAALAQEKDQADAHKAAVTAQEEATAAQMAADEKKQNAESTAALRVDQAKKRMAVYQDDLRHLTGGGMVTDSSNSTYDPSTKTYIPNGPIVLSSSGASKYDEDMRGIYECQKIISANGY